MSASQSFWPVPYQEGEPELWVCMSCLGEVYNRKIPMPDCPTCHGVSTYEAFTLEAIQDWGTDELIAKAVAARQESESPVGDPAAASSVESPE